MALNWTKLQNLVYKTLKSQGFAITVRVPGSEGVWNDTTMAYTGATEDTDYTTYGIKKAYSIRDIDGTIVQQNDTQLFFAASSLPALTTANKILISGVEQNVVNIKKTDPGDVALMWEAQIRG